MKLLEPGDRAFPMVVGAIILCILYFALRTERTVTEVLRIQSSGQGVSSNAAAGQTAPGQRATGPARTRQLLREISERDSLIAASVPRGRDPFARPVAAPRPAPAAAAAPTFVEAQPALRAIVFDEVDPNVQISIDGRTSPWLRPGDVFEGWRVIRITAGSVHLYKGDRLVELTSP